VLVKKGKHVTHTQDQRYRRQSIIGAGKENRQCQGPKYAGRSQRLVEILALLSVGGMSAATERRGASEMIDTAHGLQGGCPVTPRSASRITCVLGVPVSGLLPVLLLLCECSLTAETALDAGVIDGSHGAGWACPHSSAFVVPSSAGGRLPAFKSPRLCVQRGLVPTTALTTGASSQLRRGLGVGAWRWGLSRIRLAAHAGGFGSRSQTAGESCGKTVAEKARVESPALQEVLGDANNYSAQERRMLGALSKLGRLHGRATPAQKTASTHNSKAAGVNGQTSREQKEEMEKERRDEKLALRRRQGAHPYNDPPPPTH
jgi:hypothetical protein